MREDFCSLLMVIPIYFVASTIHSFYTITLQSVLGPDGRFAHQAPSLTAHPTLIYCLLPHVEG